MRSLELKPDSAMACYNLANALRVQGKVAKAVEYYERAVKLQPHLAEAHSNLASLLRLQGNLDASIAHYERALVFKPDLPALHYNLGNVLQNHGKPDEAVAHYLRALALKADYAEAWCNMGNVCMSQDKLDEAAACYEHALTLKPDLAEAHGNLGTTLLTQGKLEAAMAHHERALALRPNLPDSHYNLGNALQAQGKLDAATQCYERALALQPDFAKALHNLGCVRHTLGDLAGALVLYRRAQALQPDFPQARFSESLAQLAMGDFAEGWHNYEARWRTKEHGTRMRSYPQPLWTGEQLQSGRVLIWNEQGIGDEIMLAGLLPDVLRSGNRCVVDCDTRLKPLFERSFPAIEVIATCGPGHVPETEFTAHLPSGGLPRLFRTAHAAFAATTTPYLAADPKDREKFRARYFDGRRVVGLAWHTTNRKTGRSRSIDLSSLAALFARPDIQWISLQYGDHAELEQQAASLSSPILIDRGVNQLSNLDHFAAQVAAMDLVVTIDNSTAHLAGALSVPTWVLLPFAADWRWLQSREDSPWYPTLRLFRQPTPGDWQSVIQRVLSAL
jgi:tetratricopeptide (TPR) repeat protein